MNITTLPLSQITIDAGTQAREAVNDEAVNEYAEAIKAGVELPPVVLFFDGSCYYLADGFHRYFAHKRADKGEMPCDVRHGTLAEAADFADGANQGHGLRRSNADKRNAVTRMLGRHADWADNAIAKHVGVSHPFVGKVRASLVTVTSDELAEPTKRTYTTKHGTKAEMDTSGQKEAAAKKQSTKKAKTEEAAPAAAPPRVVMTTPDGEEVTDEDFGGDAEEQVAELHAENILLRAQVAAISADDPKAEALKWRMQYEHARRQQDEAMARSKRSEEREARTMKQLRRCGKAIGEDDPWKIAAAVEAFVRQYRVEAA